MWWTTDGARETTTALEVQSSLLQGGFLHAFIPPTFYYNDERRSTKTKPPFLFTTAPAGMTVREGLRGQDCPWRSLAASAFDQISGRWSQRRRRGERESWVLAALVVCKSISGNTGALIVH